MQFVTSDIYFRFLRNQIGQLFKKTFLITTNKRFLPLEIFVKTLRKTQLLKFQYFKTAKFLYHKKTMYMK